MEKNVKEIEGKPEKNGRIKSVLVSIVGGIASFIGADFLIVRSQNKARDKRNAAWERTLDAFESIENDTRSGAPLTAASPYLKELTDLAGKESAAELKAYVDARNNLTELLRASPPPTEGLLAATPRDIVSDIEKRYKDAINPATTLHAKERGLLNAITDSRSSWVSRVPGGGTTVTIAATAAGAAVAYGAYRVIKNRKNKADEEPKGAHTQALQQEQAAASPESVNTR